MAMFSARGLNNFISELRSCTSHEEEQKRVDKELGKIRQKFTQNHQLNSYDKKKYAWKLIYIFMLGYDIDFGHMQVINLVSSTKYSEKCLGYLGCSILLKSSDELMTLVVNSIRNDLKSVEASHQCLALCCVANLGGSEFSEALSPDVVSLLMSSASIAHVRKKAALCVRRMLIPNPDLIPVEDLETRLVTLMSETHLGVVTSAASLLQTSMSLHPTKLSSLYDVCVTRLGTLVNHKACPRDYMYYNTPCPWLQVKLLRILQQFGASKDKSVDAKLNDVLHRILARPLPGKGAKNNAAFAVLIETVNLVIAQGKRSDPQLKEQGIQLLARFISLSEPNIRYIGLDSMYRYVRLEGDVNAVKAHKDTVLFSLKDADNSIRRRALDLLFSMCDTENALEIVNELVNYLPVAEGAIREEIVLKAAILAEKYAKNLRWYVDTVLQLITIAGSQVPDDVWHRVVQIVTNKEELQKYAAEVMFRALEPKHIDETTAKFGAYVLGEFGYLICELPDMSSEKQFQLLHKHFMVSSIPTRCLILSAFVKMENLYDEIRPLILDVFKQCSSNMDLEIQQRACEYFCLDQIGDDLMKKVLEPMPIFPENRESALILRLRNQQKAAVGEENKIASNSIETDRIRDNDTSSQQSNHVDLLSLDSVQPVSGAKLGTSNSTATSKEVIRSANPVSDLLDVFGDAPPAPQHAVGFDAVTSAKVSEWYRNLLLNAQGVLLENEFLQIGVKQEYRPPQCRLGIFYGNKCAHSLTSFQVEIDTSKCGVSNNAFRMQTDPMASQLASKQQIVHQLMMECMAPFHDAPTLKVSFTCNGRLYAYEMRLPCHVTSFIEPVQLPRHDFLTRWQALQGQDREQYDSWKSSITIDTMQIRRNLTEDIKFALVEVRNPLLIPFPYSFRHAGIHRQPIVRRGNLPYRNIRSEWR